MKFSIVLSTQPASFSALAYKGHLAENIVKIKKLGFDGVELAVREPDLLNVIELKLMLEDNNLIVPAIGTGQAFGEEGLSFTNPEENIRRKAIERIKSHVQLANSLNAQVIIGLIRGKRNNQDEEQTEQWLIDALQECAQEDESVRFAIEPINRYESDIITTVNSGIELVRKVNLKNVGLLLDTFHMNIEEPIITDSIKSSKEHLFHFHIADSNRWYPGAGHIDFREIFKVLDEIGYNSFVSAEILPLPDPDKAAEGTMKFVQDLKTYYSFSNNS